MSDNPEKAGRKSARNFYRGTPPYSNASRNAEWQKGNDSEWAIMLEEEAAEARHASRTLYEVIDDGDFAEALRRIAEHVGMDLYA